MPGRERVRAHRERKTAAGQGTSLFDRGEFIAVDGEGFSEGDELAFRAGDGAGKLYTAREHFYAFLSASDGSSVYSNTHLTTKQCLDFLIDIRLANPLAILICFGASYDMTHMLTDLDRSEIDVLLHGDGTLANRRFVDVNLGEHDYRIEMRPRKQLSVWRWDKGAPKHRMNIAQSGKRSWVLTDCDRAILWDTWGFFQGTFVGAMAEWLPNDPDAKMIAAKKAGRSEFIREEMSDIRTYNAAELRCLVAMMERLRDALKRMDVRISRWDGAGAIAAAMLRKHSVHEAMGEPPAAVRQGALHAYAGGHIEAVKLGTSADLIHHYDVSSAYPAECIDLPDLSSGEWQHGGSSNGAAIDPVAVPSGFTLVRCSWRFEPGLPFYPLYYRETNGAILYPERGHGWYWFPEFEAAQKFAQLFGVIEFNVHEFYHFKPVTGHKPFSWVREYYAERQRIIEEARARGETDGLNMAIRLGLNALYGKLAQQVGARWDGEEWKLPRYFQLEWAGWITSATRAKLMLAAMQQPTAIISFATDAVFTTEPLQLDCPARKILGTWEYSLHQGMTIVMPGVYWCGPPPDKPGAAPKHYSRGFDKEKMQDQAFVLNAWRRGLDCVEAPSKRMVTLGSALVSDTFWPMRGMFASTTRTLKLDGGNSKRHGVAMTQCKPHRGLVATHPKDLDEDYALSLQHLLSCAYPVVWLTGDASAAVVVNDPAEDGMREAIEA